MVDLQAGFTTHTYTQRRQHSDLSTENKLTMYHWSTSSSSSSTPCYSNGSGSSNGPLLPSMASNSYGDLLLQEQLQHYYPSPPMVQRVMSAGDLQQAPAHAPAPAARYSAEERRERIEKYRTKRNQRNFQKKITVRSFSSCYLSSSRSCPTCHVHVHAWHVHHHHSCQLCVLF
jgi:hypothetical protein